MRLVPRDPAALFTCVNEQLNTPTVEDLVQEAEAVIFELERRMRKAEQEQRALSTARDKVRHALGRTT